MFPARSSSAKGGSQVQGASVAGTGSHVGYSRRCLHGVIAFGALFCVCPGMIYVKVGFTVVFFRCNTMSCQSLVVARHAVIHGLKHIDESGD